VNEKSGFTIKSITNYISIPALFCGGFWVLTMVLGVMNGIRLPMMLSDTLGRFGRWGILTLAMVPSIQSGTGPNFALPIGILCGSLAAACAIQWGFEGWGFMFFAVFLAVSIAIIIGYIYGKLMNAVKGSEMVIATYTGFAFVFLFCMLWYILPFSDLRLRLPMGQGLRQDVQMESIGARSILDNLLRFEIGGVVVPTGMLLVFFLACFLVWLFMRSKTGIAITAGGTNPMFANAAGINVNQGRVFANILSTTLAAVGIIVYAQSYAFLQYYQFALFTAFTAVAAIIIGGATVRRAKIFHVILGCLIFQGISATTPPVANALFAGTELPETIRTIVQNGVILYALMQVKGGKSK
ncbi:MAG: ABC transporter permease, partial [Clostridia bacterium]|nr:ABC transporter permease [Clostridia bacterium]